MMYTNRFANNIVEINPTYPPPDPICDEGVHDGVPCRNGDSWDVALIVTWNTK